MTDKPISEKVRQLLLEDWRRVLNGERQLLDEWLDGDLAPDEDGAVQWMLREHSAWFSKETELSDLDLKPCLVGVSWRSPEMRLRAWAAAGAPVLTPEASAILEAARAMPVALRGGQPVDPWMGLARLAEALRAEGHEVVGVPRELVPLWEWVRACEEWPHAAVMVCARQENAALSVFFDLDGRLGGTPCPDEDDHPDIIVEIEAGAFVKHPLARVYAGRDEGGCYAKCRTLAELRAALDALAKEANDG